AAVHAGVEVALAGADVHVEGDQASRRQLEHRQVAAEHAAVEDDRGVRAAAVGGEVVDDRATADLLLPVAREAEVDGQRACLDEPLRGAQQDPELALVVGDAAPVRPLAADRELEGIALPALERRGRLHVEVPVAEDGGRVRRVGGRRDLAERELLFAERSELRGAPDPADALADPLAGTLDVVAVRRVGAHARDGDQLSELGALRGVHGTRLYAEHPPGRDAAGARGVPRRWSPVERSKMPGYATSWRACDSASARSFFRLWFSIWRIRSRVTLKARPTSSSVRGCSPSSP